MKREREREFRSHGYVQGIRIQLVKNIPPRKPDSSGCISTNMVEENNEMKSVSLLLSKHIHKHKQAHSVYINIYSQLCATNRQPLIMNEYVYAFILTIKKARNALHI